VISVCPSQTRPAILTDGLPAFACPNCKGMLFTQGSGFSCGDCYGEYPIVAGIPDLRIASDRYLNLDDERDKAKQLARVAERADLSGLVVAYYAMTADVDAAQRARFRSHIARAEQRGAGLSALLPTRGRILEVGCGTGGLLAAARRTSRMVVGVDIALRWLVVAQQRLEENGTRAPLVAACAEALPWPDSTFDAVVADSVLEHLDHPAIALDEFWRVLRPGGTLTLWSPNRFSVLPDPHVGLWGLGWLPPRWATAYVRRRRHCEWAIRPLSAGEGRALFAPELWDDVRVEAARLPVELASGLAERIGLAVYNTASLLSGLSRLLRWLGPVWQIRATKKEVP
jgi:SAM-dependent methyltransferase